MTDRSPFSRAANRHSLKSSITELGKRKLEILGIFVCPNPYFPAGPSPCWRLQMRRARRGPTPKETKKETE